MRRYDWKELVFGLVLFIIIIFVMPGIGGYYETHYTREGVVISAEKDVVVVRDTTGNEWDFQGEGFVKGDNVKMSMFNNYTNDIDDDEILDVEVIK